MCYRFSAMVQPSHCSAHVGENLHDLTFGQSATRGKLLLQHWHDRLSCIELHQDQHFKHILANTVDGWINVCHWMRTVTQRLLQNTLTHHHGHFRVLTIMAISCRQRYRSCSLLTATRLRASRSLLAVHLTSSTTAKPPALYIPRTTNFYNSSNLRRSPSAITVINDKLTVIKWETPSDVTRT